MRTRFMAIALAASLVAAVFSFTGCESVLDEKSAAAELFLTAVPFMLKDGSSANNIKVTWSLYPDARSYKVYRDGSLVWRTTGDTFDDYDLASGAAYNYTVEAYKVGGKLLAASAPVRVETFTPNGTYVEWDNTTSGNNLEEPEGLLINGTYYRYIFLSEGSGTGRTVKIVEQTSSDGLTSWGGDRELVSHTDAKLESVRQVYNPATGKVVINAHYENGSDYTLARLYLASVTPGGNDFEVGFNGRPFDNVSRDQSIFIDTDGKAYVFSANGGDIKIYALNESWTDVEAEVAHILKGESRETPEVVRKDGTLYFFSSRQSGWYPSQVMYTWAPGPAGPWAPLQEIANASTYGTQSTGIHSFGPDKKTWGLYGWRWQANYNSHAGGPNYPRLLPVAFNRNFVSMEYYSRVRYYTGMGLVGVQAGRNLSLGKTATSSSTSSELALGNPLYITDGGDLASSGQFRAAALPYEITVDLESPAVLTEINTTCRLVGGSEGAFKYTISGSADGQSYTQLIDGSANWRVGFLIDPISNATPYRYVKLRITNILNVSNGDAGAAWADGIHEFAVFGTPEPEPAEPVPEP